MTAGTLKGTEKFIRWTNGGVHLIGGEKISNKYLFSSQPLHKTEQLYFFAGYNRRVRPQTAYGGPITINVNLDVRSMGPVDENK